MTPTDHGVWLLKAVHFAGWCGPYEALVLAAALVVVVSFVSMGPGRSLRHVSRHPGWFSAAAVVGFAFPAVLVNLAGSAAIQLPAGRWMWPTLLSLAVVPILACALSWKSLVSYWRRLLRTLGTSDPQADPPAQPAVLLSVAGLFTVPAVLAAGPVVSASAPASLTMLAGILLLAWLAGPLLVARARPEPPPHADGSLRPADKSGVYSDDPIRAEDEDLLDRASFARKLASEIKDLPGHESFVFSLQAGWGEGKTSVLNLVKRQLNDNPDFVVVDFNPWYFGSELGVFEGFYGALEAALSDRFILPSFGRLMRRYLKALSVGLARAPVSIGLDLAEDPDRVRRDIEAFIAGIGVKVVVIVDDIDRLERKLALSALSLSRLSARLENTVFLLAFDPKALEDKKIPQDYLEKIVQRPVALPPVEQRFIDRFLVFSDESVVSETDRLLDGLDGVGAGRREAFQEEMKGFYPRIRRYFTTLRAAKRFLGVLRSSLPPIAAEVNLFDFFVLTVLQVFAFEVYRDIWACPQYYLGTEVATPGGGLFTHESDSEARKQAMSEHLEEIQAKGPQLLALEDVLAALFPSLEPGKPGVLVRRFGQSAEQRLADRVSFPKYFLGRVPGGQLSDAEVREAIGRWNSAGTTTAGLAAEDLEAYQTKGASQEFLERLDVFRDDCPQERAEGVAGGLATFTARIQWDNGPAGPAARTLLGLVVSLAERHSPEDPAAVIERLLPIGSTYFAAGVVSWAHGAWSGFPNLMQSFPELQASAEADLHRRLVEGGRDIFDECPHGYADVLLSMATAWGTRPETEAVTLYVVDLIEKHPSKLGRLLTAFAPKAGMPGWFEELFRILSPERISELYERYGDEALPRDEDKAAWKIFLERRPSSGGGTGAT